MTNSIINPAVTSISRLDLYRRQEDDTWGRHSWTCDPQDLAAPFDSSVACQDWLDNLEINEGQWYAAAVRATSEGDVVLAETEVVNLDSATR